MTYKAKIDGGMGGTESFEADTLAEALEKAKDWAARGDWDVSKGTIWVDIAVESEDGEEEKSETLGIDPEEPDCIDGEHDWQSPHEIVGGIEENPGVWGHGGGVTISECCMKCGCRKFTDTWAQNPSSGEQGLDSVSYDLGHYKDALAKYNVAHAD